MTQQVLEKAVEHKVPVHLCFVNLSKAYDSVNRTAMLAVLRLYGVPQQLVEIIQDLYTGPQCQVRTEDDESQVFEVKTGVIYTGLYLVSSPVQLFYGQISQGHG